MNKWLSMLVCLFATSVAFAGEPTPGNEYHFLVVSDTHVGVQHTMEVAPQGYNPKNDLDETTFVHLMQGISKTLARDSLQPQSLIITGDLVDHVDGSIELGSPEGRRTQLALNFRTFLKTFPDLPMLYAFGNNDSLDGDYLAFYSPSEELPSPWHIAVNEGWGTGPLSTGTVCESNEPTHFPCLMGETANVDNGYYVARLTKGLRLIVLNSVLYDGDYDWIYHGNDYNNQTKWFDAAVNAARTAGDTVLVAMHVPPGISLHNDKFSWQKAAEDSFLKTLAANKGTVIGVLVAHTHMEELRVILEDTLAIPVIYTSALSTQHGNAPSFKYFTLTRDPKSQAWQLYDYQTYSYVQNTFAKLYDFQAYYCPQGVYTGISNCLSQYVSTHDLAKLLGKMSLYYTAGNPNYSPGLSGKHPEELLIQSVMPAFAHQKTAHVIQE